MVPPEKRGSVTMLDEPVVEHDDLAPGTKAGAYFVAGPLGKGGTGTVYLAIRSSDGRHAAVKVLRHDLVGVAGSAERFLREVEVLTQLRHPNIVELFEVGALPDGRPWFAMEVLDGETLRHILDARGVVAPHPVLKILDPVCAALDAAHAMKIIHRDVKAENVMVTSDGRVKLLDFGIAKMAVGSPQMQRLTTTGGSLGTPMAMSPEQIRAGVVDARTDVYALGVLMYQMLTGGPPFKGFWGELVVQHMSAIPEAPSARADVPRSVDQVVLRCLEKDPGKRYSTAGQVLAAYRWALAL